MRRSTTHRRLNKLADYLETVPRKLFNMERWGTDTPCGTAACVAGHACTLFPREMRLHRVSEYSTGYHVVTRRNDGKWMWTWGSRAFARTFGVKDDEATEICEDFSLCTPKQAAKKVRGLAKKYAPQAARRRAG
jgi:hypothetical protein